MGATPRQMKAKCSELQLIEWMFSYQRKQVQKSLMKACGWKRSYDYAS
jgi:hypothetical protein